VVQRTRDTDAGSGAPWLIGLTPRRISSGMPTSPIAFEPNDPGPKVLTTPSPAPAGRRRMLV